MTLMMGSRAHPGDDDLFRYMDRQLTLERARRLRSHVAVCGECTARLQALQARTERFSEWLGGLGPAVPDPERRAAALAAVERARFRRTRFSVPAAGRNALLQAAAVVLLLLALGVGTRPGRAWVAETVSAVAGDPPGPLASRVLGWLGHAPGRGAHSAVARLDSTRVPAAAEGAAPPEAARAALPPGASPPVAFTPSGPGVTLVFRSIQRGGGATLWLRDADDATAQITSGGRGEALVPTAAGLEVRNRSESVATYELIVPVRYRFVRVRLGNGEELVIPITKSKLDWIWNINLRESALD